MLDQTLQYADNYSVTFNTSGAENLKTKTPWSEQL